MRSGRNSGDLPRFNGEEKAQKVVGWWWQGEGGRDRKLVLHGVNSSDPCVEPSGAVCPSDIHARRMGCGKDGGWEQTVGRDKEREVMEGRRAEKRSNENSWNRKGPHLQGEMAREKRRILLQKNMPCSRGLLSPAIHIALYRVPPSFFTPE